MEHTSAEVRSGLKDLLETEEGILAVWEGGAAATGFLDRYSDLDLMIVTRSEDTEPVFALLEQHFQARYGIERMFRMPEPAWHGMSQCFYLLKDFPDFFYCDIAVVPESNPRKFTEPDRHGHSVVWFDRVGFLPAAETPAEELDQMLARIYRAVTAADWISIIELKKALARENWIAAQMNYHAFLNRLLVPLLNIKYRPAKADFGIRYADRDYPPDVASELEKWLKVASVEEIRSKAEQALGLFEKLKEELAPSFAPIQE